MPAKKSNEAAPLLPAEVQPAGSGATPGTAPAEETLGERLKSGAEGVQVQPGVNDGAEPKMDPELGDTDTDAELAEEAGEPMVKYTGEFSRREISVADWQGAGVPDMPAVVWDRAHGMQVPRSVFSEQALQVLRQEGHFEVP